MSQEALDLKCFGVLEHIGVPAYVFEQAEAEYLLRYINAEARSQNPDIEHFLGLPMARLYSDPPEMLEDARRAMEEQTPVTRDVLLRRHDHTEPTFALRIRFIPQTKRHLLVTTHAIDSNGGAELALRESEARYRGLFAALPDAVIVRGSDGRILACNEAGARLLGEMDPALVVGREKVMTEGVGLKNEAGELLTEDDLPSLRAVRTGARVDPQIVERSDGETVRWLRVSAEPIFSQSGAVTASVTLLTDITDRVLSERAARAAATRLDLALQASKVGVWEYDFQSDTGWWSSNLDTLFGFGNERPPNLETFLMRLHPEDRAKLQSIASAFTADGSRELEAEFRLMGDDGVARWARLQGRKLDPPTRVAGTVTDTTTQRRMEEELRRSHRLESIGRLAGGVAHDFNNLLAAMMVSLEVLGTRTTEDSREDLMTIRHAVLRARDLTRQLLAFAKKQPIEFKRVDLAELVKTVERLLHRLVGPAIEIVVERESGVIVRADGPSLEQVLVNLVVNARDAMPNGGRLVVRVGTTSVLVDDAPTQRALLEVVDSGVGMDEVTRAHVFEPFFTTKNSGTGLGLASCYGIIRQHDGDIVVESEPGRGTTFRILLPVTASTSRPEAKARSITPPTTRASRVLIVDDEDLVRRASVRLFKSLGYEVLSAGSASAAIELVRDRELHVDLLFCDVAMPERDGPSLAAELLESRPDLQIIFVSGFSETDVSANIERALFLPKPFSRDELVTKLKEVESRS
ncbi:MAG: ATP-binding protein [Polyangiaceae bacterium]